MEANRLIQERSTCWQHFDMLWVVEDNGVERRQARCKYCFATLKADPSRHEIEDALTRQDGQGISVVLFLIV
ncbi:unnamed protein product [Lactuca virosa]|uniref:Uncharacterized protein n=1 Tax=Lactuca virosa TaxID=75947 RepID=A0AAU9NJS6_9ASTR|nr:unnamed protein product [Lactuca virosa]